MTRFLAIPPTALAACWVPKVREPRSPPKHTHHRGSKCGLSWGGLRQCQEGVCDQEWWPHRRGQGAPATPLPPPQPIRPVAPRLGNFQEPQGRSRVFQAKSSPLCSPLCNQSERLPGWSHRPRKSWRKNTTRLSPSQPGAQESPAGWTDGGRTDRPVVPPLSLGTKVQGPSVSVAGSPNELSRSAHRLAVKAFSKITFKLHVSSRTPGLWDRGWGQCHPGP